MSTHDGLLRRHVIESNLIEGIRARPGEAEYDGHLAAARMAAAGVASPHHLHAVLARRVPGLGAFGGRMRTCGMRVGSRRMPRWQEVPALMSDWEKLAGEYALLDGRHAEAALFLHDWLLCIHPWVDGNGRTARLVWNMLRVSKGLPWRIQPARTRRAYYARIEAIEDGVFRTRYPRAY